MKEFFYHPNFAFALALLNGWFCIVNLNAGAWGWAALSGGFCYLCADNWRRMRR